MTTLPRGRGLTVADIEAMPDDGQRYELIDGVLVVSAMPTPRHQRVAMRLGRVLDDAAPPDLWVLSAPIDVVLDRSTGVAPDLVVAPRKALGGKRLEQPPLLAVEILSPATRVHDYNVKFARYERAAIPAYWVVDPDELRLTAWELRDGRYVEVADVVDGEWTAHVPFEVTVRPSSLLD